MKALALESVLRILVLMFAAVPALAGGAPRVKDAWEWTIDERVASRHDPVLAAARRAVALKEGQLSADSDLNVVLGSRNPELLLPWELMDRLLVAFTFRDAAVSKKYRERWFADAEGSPLGPDAFARIETLLREFIDASSETERLQAALDKAGPQERPTLQLQWEKANDSICPLRAKALNDARETFGRANFDRFLYDVIAPGAVILTTPAKNPHSRAELESWVEGGCR